MSSDDNHQLQETIAWKNIDMRFETVIASGNLPNGGRVGSKSFPDATRKTMTIVVAPTMNRCIWAEIVVEIHGPAWKQRKQVIKTNNFEYAIEAYNNCG